MGLFGVLFVCEKKALSLKPPVVVNKDNEDLIWLFCDLHQLL